MANKKAKALGINHIVLEVEDLDQALEFYGKLFEFGLRGRNEHNAFIDLGDQFIQLRLGRTQEPDGRGTVKQALEELGVEMLERGMNFRDPWGNRVEIVPYDDIQYTKAPNILRGMGIKTLEKSSSAMEELAKKNMAPE